MINIDDQAKFNMISPSPKASSGIMHSSQKKTNRILSHMEKCMRSTMTTTKFNAEQREEMMRMAKTQLKGELKEKMERTWGNS